LPAETPAKIRTLLDRCLRKDARQRLRDIGDASLEIDDVKNTPHGDSQVAQLTSRRKRLVWISIVALLAIVAVVRAVAFRLQGSLEEIRLDIATPPTRDPLALALSPDGRSIAFIATIDGKSTIWVRSLDSDSPRPLVGTEGASGVFWSADSRSIGFTAGASLKRIDLNGGYVKTLALQGASGDWNRDGVLLFFRGVTISRVSEWW
jgi:serine/threonine-protein kinase